MKRFTEKELELLENLKTMSIKDAAGEIGISRAYADTLLTRIRDKIEDGRQIVNTAANLMKHQRLAKLLRRQP